MAEMWNWIVAIDVFGARMTIGYWVPMTICLIGYTFRTVLDCMRDVDCRERYSPPIYEPSITVGTVVKRVIVSATPGFNWLIAIFEFFLDRWIPAVEHWLERTLCRPLVPPKKTSEE